MLLQSASSFGLPLAGIAVDPQRREVYGLLGRPGKDVPPNFFILWKGTKGGDFAATFEGERNDTTGVCEILPDGETRTVHDFRAARLDESKLVDPSVGLRSIVRALPPDPSLPER